MESDGANHTFQPHPCRPLSNSDTVLLTDWWPWMCLATPLMMSSVFICCKTPSKTDITLSFPDELCQAHLSNQEGLRLGIKSPELLNESQFQDIKNVLKNATKLRMQLRLHNIVSQVGDSVKVLRKFSSVKPSQGGQQVTNEAETVEDDLRPTNRGSSSSSLEENNIGIRTLKSNPVS